MIKNRPIINIRVFYSTIYADYAASENENGERAHGK